MTPRQILSTYFGYPDFRPGQLDIIKSVLKGSDTLAVLPTGGGKSLCYQIPSLVMGGTSIVVSPLISLMKDQVDQLNSRGIAATFLNSSVEPAELANRLDVMQAGGYRFVYLAPERLQTRSFLAVCQKLPLSVITVDEAHCVSQWGHDFRPEYRTITQFVKSLPYRPPLIAVTATATPRVQADIRENLGMKSPATFIHSFRRSNLSLRVTHCPNRFFQQFVLSYLLQTHLHQSIIVYTLTREAAERVGEVIKFLLPQLRVAVYHGGLSHTDRAQIQDSFVHNQVQVVVATNAFGMGVDKPDIRLVIHYHLPVDVEGYYQEVGRAGRDGQPAACEALHFPPDLEVAAGLVARQSEVSTPQTHIRQRKWRQLQYFATTRTRCRFKMLDEYFGESEALADCGQCDWCLHQPLQPSFKFVQRYQQLLNFRQQLAQRYFTHPAAVMTEPVMHWLTLLQPRTMEAVLRIPGIGKGWVQKWGKVILPHIED